ncbi:hypothetical protein SNK04_014175 [Fusarium graminearum]
MGATERRISFEVNNTHDSVHPWCTGAPFEKRGKKWRAMVASSLILPPRRPSTVARPLRIGLALRKMHFAPAFRRHRNMTLEALIDRYIKEMDRFKPVSAISAGTSAGGSSLGDREVSTLTGQDILNHIRARTAPASARNGGTRRGLQPWQWSLGSSPKRWPPGPSGT